MNPHLFIGVLRFLKNREGGGTGGGAVYRRGEALVFVNDAWILYQ